MKCVYCHAPWHIGARCACGAVYHEECLWEMKACATIGCEEFLMISSPKKIERVPSFWEGVVEFFQRPRGNTAPRTRRRLMDRINTALNNPTLEKIDDII